MPEQPINLSSSGPPDTVLPPESQEAIDALHEALALDFDNRKAAVSAVVEKWPRYLDAWARLGELADEPIEAYAYYRIGYHRGLDKLRGSGWRGSGYVRWINPSNQGFLRSLIGLRHAAASIGENDEVERIGEFLRQLDPDLEH